MTEEKKAELMYEPPEDVVFYLNAVKGLPGLEGFSGTGLDEWGNPIPWGTGPHSVRFLREACEIVKPKRIFVIGFNMGYADVVFLELLPDVQILSCDISQKAETKAADKIISERYLKRFIYSDKNNPYFDNLVRAFSYDMCFIDGSHLYDDVVKDIELCLALKIKYLLFDDFLPEFGFAGDAARSFEPKIELVKEMGNMALYKNNGV